MGHRIAERVEGCAAADVRGESRERLGRRLKSHLDPDGLIRSSAKNGRRRLRRGRAATSRAECPQRPAVRCHLAFPAGLTFGFARTVDLTRDSPAPTNRTARPSEPPRTTTRPRILPRLKRPWRRTERPRQQGCCRPTRSRRGTIEPMTLPNAPACGVFCSPAPCSNRRLCTNARLLRVRGPVSFGSDLAFMEVWTSNRRPCARAVSTSLHGASFASAAGAASGGLALIPAATLRPTAESVARRPQATSPDVEPVPTVRHMGARVTGGARRNPGAPKNPAQMVPPSA